MRFPTALALFCALTAVASAQSRPMSTAMTCAQAQAMVAARGAVVMGFSPSTYDRVVRDQRFCLMSEVLVPIDAPTRDTPHCPIGYTCREGDNWNREPFPFRW